MLRLKGILLIGLLAAITFNGVGQSCNPPPLAGFYFVENGVGCAPLQTKIETLFSDLNAGSEITIDWGDGSAPDVYITTAIQMNNTFTHTYPSNFTVCEYTITATAVKNCVDRSSATFSSEVTVWDDDQTGMNVSGPYYICQGFGSNIQFTDNSTWNCFPGTSLPNNDPRTLQWIYGIGGTSLDGATVSGNPAPPAYSGGQYTANSPGTQSLNVNIPATRPDGSQHNIGDRFYIQLNNWNYCNPQPLPPVTGFSYVEIVAPPSPIFETQLNNSSGPMRSDFCPGDVIYFDNDTPNMGGNSYIWHFFDDPTGTNLIGTSNNFNPTYSYTNPGLKLVRLHASTNNVIGNCNVTYEGYVNIVSVPIADIQINAQAYDDDLIQFCEDTSLPTGYSVTFNNVSTGFTPFTEFYLDFYDENDVRFLFFASNFSTLSTQTVDFANSGIHKVILRAVDPVTTCETVDTAFVEIYSRPSANFQIVDGTDICVGKTVSFDDLSENYTSTWSGIPGDTITEYRWWFEYDGNPVSPPDQVITNASNGNTTHTFNTPGNFDVRLQVSKPFTSVCEIDMIVPISVYDIPNASFSPDVTEGCPDLSVTLTNNSFPQPVGITIDYEWIVTDLFTGSVQNINYSNPSTDTTMVFSHSRGDNLNHQYTVQLLATSNIGCQTFSSVETITVYPGPNSGFTSDFDPFTLNCSPVPVNFAIDANTLSIPNIDEFVWTVDDGVGNITNYSRNPGQTTFSHSFPNNTMSTMNYTVTLNVNLSPSGCVAPFQQLVRVNPNPISDFNTVIVNESCDFVTVNIDAIQKGLSQYDWTISSPTVNSPILDDNFDLIFDRPENNQTDLVVTMTLNTENLTGCQSPVITTKNFTIVKKEDLAVDLDLISGNDLCNNAEGVFENNTLSYPVGTIWSLFVTKGSGSPVDVTTDITGDLTGSFSYQFTQDGSYRVELVALLPSGCSFSRNANLTVHPDVVAQFSTNGIESCAPFEMVINEFSTNASDIQTKFWTIDNLTSGANVLPRQSINLTNYTFPNNTASFIDYAITLEVASFNNCVDDTTITVRVFPEPQVDFNIVGPNPSCAPFEVAFENISSNQPGTTYIWNWGDGTMTSMMNTDPDFDVNITHTFNNTSFFADKTVNVILTALTPDFCTKEVIKTVTLNTLVNSDFNTDKTQGCSPLTINFDNFSQGNGSPNSGWYYTDLSTGVRTRFSDDYITSYTFTNAGTAAKDFLIEYEAINLGGCTDISSTTISVLPEIAANFSFNGSNQSCSPYPVVFENQTIISGVTYIWNWGDGSENDTTTVETTVSHSFENNSTSLTKNYNVTLTAVNELTGCIAQDAKIITVFPDIVTNVAPDIPEGCGPLRVNFVNNTTGIGLIHTWYYREKGSTDKLEMLSTAFASYELSNPTINDIVYEVIYEVENTNGCMKTEIFEITVYPEIDAKFSVDPIRQIMPNRTVNIINQSTPGNWNYQWEFGDDVGVSSEEQPGSYMFDNYGNYQISLTVSNPVRDCASQYNALVTIEPEVPDIDFTFDPGSGCLPFTVNFTNLSVGADENSYEWDFGDNRGYSNEINPTYTYYKAGVFTVTLTATNALGIRVSEVKEQIITVYDLPRASFVARPSIVYLPDAPVAVQNYSVGASIFEWDFGDGTIYNEYEPRHYYQSTGEYYIQLVASSEQGCSDTLRVESAITAINGGQVKIPNAFTPNLSGPGGQGGVGFASNDIFLPIIEGVVEYNMQIFNRWGEMLFETKDQTYGWDGYYKGKLSPQGVYLYKLDLKFISGESTTRVGDFTLIR